MTTYQVVALEADRETEPWLFATVAMALRRWIGREAYELAGRLATRHANGEIVVLAVTDEAGAFHAILTAELAGKRLHVVTMAGERMHEYLESVLLPALEELARDQGARELACSGRAGWARVLGGYGWRFDARDEVTGAVTMVKEISDVRSGFERVH